ncbi:nucleoside hydrolase [Bacillus sp. H-16]|uniref:nucleoside hydrolase n=1 Tax=Alteribacter salitolerans TaxID=2912333 RepID=UPI00196494AC|nr:nucleoside hydrolase [Alteribacter salitolerans]MBM7095041.1 nucleoside hydrolase [Alteribacter salitolerans]
MKGRVHQEKKKVLLFCDPGIDDAVAIFYAVMHPQIELVGIVADYGNTTRENAVRNVVYLLELLHVENVPVFAGAEGPLTGKEVQEQPDIHGEFGLGTINVPEEVDVEPFENFFDVIDVIKNYRDEVVIVTTGRLTSLAALCTFYPMLMHRVVSEYVVMGGAFFVPGNITPLAEANIYEDPIAAKLVIGKASMITIVPLNVTDQLLVPMKVIREIAFDNGYVIFEALVDYYYDFYEAATVDELLGTPLHDVVALSVLVNPEFYEFVDYRVFVESSDTSTAGVTFPDLRRLEELKPGPVHRVAVEADEHAFLNDFVRILSRKKDVDM